MHLSAIMEGKYGSDILVWRLKKVKRLDFALIFCYLDKIFLRGKKNNRRKVKKLRGRLFLWRFLTSLLFQQFSLPL